MVLKSQTWCQGCQECQGCHGCQGCHWCQGCHKCQGALSVVDAPGCQGVLWCRWVRWVLVHSTHPRGTTAQEQGRYSITGATVAQYRIQWSTCAPLPGTCHPNSPRSLSAAQGEDHTPSYLLYCRSVVATMAGSGDRSQCPRSVPATWSPGGHLLLVSTSPHLGQGTMLLWCQGAIVWASKVPPREYPLPRRSRYTNSSTSLL